MGVYILLSSTIKLYTLKVTLNVFKIQHRNVFFDTEYLMHGILVLPFKSTYCSKFNIQKQKLNLPFSGFLLILNYLKIN